VLSPHACINGCTHPMEITRIRFLVFVESKVEDRETGRSCLTLRLHLPLSFPSRRAQSPQPLPSISSPLFRLSSLVFTERIGTGGAGKSCDGGPPCCRYATWEVFSEFGFVECVGLIVHAVAADISVSEGFLTASHRPIRAFHNSRQSDDDIIANTATQSASPRAPTFSSGHHDLCDCHGACPADGSVRFSKQACVP
jgi:hypothetical protein